MKLKKQMPDKNGVKEPSDQETFNQSQEPKDQVATGKIKPGYLHDLLVGIKK